MVSETHASAAGPVLADLRGETTDDTVIRHADAHARASGSELILCRAALPVESDDSRLALHRQREEIFERVGRITARHAAEVTVLQPLASPVRGLALLAQQLNAGMIVTSGTVTASVLHRSVSCPVLLSRARAAGAVLAATDLTDRSLSVLETAARVALSKALPLRLFHAVEPESDVSRRRLIAESLLRAFARRVGLATEVVISVGRPAAELIRAAAAAPTELLVIGRRRNQASRGLEPSVAELALTSVNCSVLLVQKE